MLPRLVTAVPGPKSQELAAILRQYECQAITAFDVLGPIFLSRGRGANLWDVDGNQYLDLGSGFGVASLGHGYRPVVAQAQKQLTCLVHAMGDLYPAEAKAALCRKLSFLTFEAWGLGTGKTILTNSGSEAVEVALKTACLATGKAGILYFKGAYHGLTYGALAVGGIELFRSPFNQQLPSFGEALPFPDCWHCPWVTPRDPKECAPTCRTRFEQILWERVRSKRFAAVLVEPVLGRGGQIVPPGWLLPLLRRVTAEEGMLLILDEILTGWYRTGKRFACDHAGVVPDIVCLGKALTHGFPMGACVGRQAVMDHWPVSRGEALHTSTFLGHPVGCQMALAALEGLEREGPRLGVPEKGRLLLERLVGLASRFSILRAPRGLGLLAGVDVVDNNGRADPQKAIQIAKRLLERGLVLVPSGVKGSSLSFCPPLTIRRKELQWALEELERVLGSMA